MNMFEYLDAFPGESLKNRIGKSDMDASVSLNITCRHGFDDWFLSDKPTFHFRGK